MDAKELRKLAEAAISNPPNDLWYLSQIDPNAVIELLDRVDAYQVLITALGVNTVELIR